jgi:hypothetical protein
VVVLATVVASMIVEEGDHWIQVGYSHLAVLWAMVGDSGVLASHGLS